LEDIHLAKFQKIGFLSSWIVIHQFFRALRKLLDDRCTERRSVLDEQKLLRSSCSLTG
jgi:hypothetical protein